MKFGWFEILIILYSTGTNVLIGRPIYLSDCFKFYENKGVVLLKAEVLWIQLIQVKIIFSMKLALTPLEKCYADLAPPKLKL